LVLECDLAIALSPLIEQEDDSMLSRIQIDLERLFLVFDHFLVNEDKVFRILDSH